MNSDREMIERRTETEMVEMVINRKVIPYN